MGKQIDSHIKNIFKPENQTAIGLSVDRVFFVAYNKINQLKPTTMTETQTMSVIDLLQNELEQEAQTTRKILERVPNDKYDWQPHPKSMTIKQLATHIAELPGWISMGLTTDELDFAATPYAPENITNTPDLLALLERSIASGKSSLSEATEENLLPTWTLRNGDQIYMVMTKYEVVRHALSQLIHHRAQLGVYLRLLNISIPGSYGPSADEQNF